MRRGFRFWLAMLIAAGCSSTGEPGSSDDPCGDNYPAARMTVIGPEGGGIGIPDNPTDTFAFEGWQLVVPAGTWAECWEVTFDLATNTPGYPDGFEPVTVDPVSRIKWSLDLQIYRQTEDGGRRYAPDSMYLELHFPLATVPQASSSGAYAFAYDAAMSDWRVFMAGKPDPDDLVVPVHHWRGLWSFGSIDLADVDVERYLVPALADRMGTEEWNRLEAALDSVYQVALSQTSQLNCVGLDILEGFFQGTRDWSATALRNIDAQVGCGACDATTSQFWDEYKLYLGDRGLGMMVEFAADMAGEAVGLGPLAGAGVGYAVGELTQFMIGDYGCDYQCFVDAIDWTFFFHLAIYGASNGLIDVINWYRQSYTSCPALAGTTPSWQEPLLRFGGGACERSPALGMED